MSITLNDSRQAPLWAHVDINLADFSDGAVQAAMQLPGDAIIVDGFIQPITAFNAATTATLKVGDSGNDDRYTATPADVKAVAVVPLDITGYQMPVQGDLTVTYASTGTAATTGKCRLFVGYIRAGRTQTTQG
jgi:hypothetical protein